MRILVADLVTELEPRYDDSRELAEPFRYEGSRETDIKLHVSDKLLNNLMEKAAAGTTVGEMENFALGNDFNRKAIAFNTMLIHSSALVYDGGAYLFSADSGVGKSTHTRLWLTYIEDTDLMNDDNPVVRITADGVVAVLQRENAQPYTPQGCSAVTPGGTWTVTDEGLRITDARPAHSRRTADTPPVHR